MKKILVVNVNWVGDVIFSSPIFRALKENYPSARISCLAVPRVKDILESCPYLDQVIVYDEEGTDRGPLAKLRLIWRLRREKFDAVFLLHRSWTRALLVFGAGIPVRVGYDTKKRGIFLTHKIAPLDPGAHRRDHYLQVIEGFGVQVKDRSCELKVSESAGAEVEKILLQNGLSAGEKFVVINTGGNWDLKRWPKENWAELIKILASRLKLAMVIPGANKDIALAETIAQAAGVKTIVLAGQTNLKQLIALMAKAAAVVSADSGPMHIANCVGTPLAAIFGPTRPETTGPRGKGKFVILQKDVKCNRAPCYNLTCPDNVCMQAVTPEEVAEEVFKIVNI